MYEMIRNLILPLLVFLLAQPVFGAARVDDEEPVMEDDGLVMDGDEPGEEGDPPGSEADAKGTPPAPVPQRVEQVSDGQGLLTSVDQYDAETHLVRLRKDAPRFHLEGALGLATGLGQLASHVGPQVQVSGLYRPWRHLAVGASFAGTLLMHQGLAHSGFAPLIDLHVLVPLARPADALTPERSWELGLFTRVGYVSQGVLVEQLKQRADGVYLSAGVTVYYWISESVRVFGRLEVAFPQWTGLCEESASSRHCAVDPNFSGQLVLLTGGVSLAVW